MSDKKKWSFAWEFNIVFVLLFELENASRFCVAEIIIYCREIFRPTDKHCRYIYIYSRNSEKPFKYKL